MYDAVSIARFVINYSNKQEYGISNLKLVDCIINLNKK